MAVRFCKTCGYVHGYFKECPIENKWLENRYTYEDFRRRARKCEFLETRASSGWHTCLHSNNPTAIGVRVCSVEHCPTIKEKNINRVCKICYGIIDGYVDNDNTTPNSHCECFGRVVPVDHFVLVIAANVDNERLDDVAFREFVRNTLRIVDYR